MPKSSRRAFLEAGVRAGLNACAAGFLMRANTVAQGSRPAIAEGVAAGDVSHNRAIVWSRTDRPARLIVDYSTREDFTGRLWTRRGPNAVAASDFTARVELTDLPRGQRIFYRARFQSLDDIRAWSEPVVGSFRTPSASAERDVTIAWSADTVGQGWGINTEWGGLRLYDTMLRAEPDVFIHCGDTIYADQPLLPEVKLDDGTIWRNVVTEAKSKVAQTLDDFRGNYKYNLLDDHMRRFNAAVPQIVLWDDHEVRDNWYYERDLSRDERYQEKNMQVLAKRAKQAFREYNPVPEQIDRTIHYGPLVDVFALDLRSYRGANSGNRQPELTPASELFGWKQLDRLKVQLSRSRATWKVIASDLPIGLIVPDGRTFFEAFANADDGPPLGRELEIRDLLRFIKQRKIANVVWVTADVHYCAAHYYSPARAQFTEFDPFWEFVAGPLHAGTFGPNALDATFGPDVKFNGVPAGMKGNRPPSDGLQFYGTLKVDARSRAMTARLHDLSGKALYQVELAAS